MRRWRTSPRAGFTLLEMAMVMAALGLVMLLLSATMIGSLRTQQLAIRVSNRVMAHSTLADQFRADVARAVEAPSSLGELGADSNRLILRMSGGKTVVYDFSKGQLERSEVVGTKRSSRRLPLGDDRTTVEFRRPGGVNLVLLRLVESPVRGPKQVIEVAAALGGDLR
jgi:prepilin-type N-terminal cleavage/methylation domain-containing protein